MWLRLTTCYHLVSVTYISQSSWSVWPIFHSPVGQCDLYFTVQLVSVTYISQSSNFFCINYIIVLLARHDSGELQHNSSYSSSILRFPLFSLSVGKINLWLTKLDQSKWYAKLYFYFYWCGCSAPFFRLRVRTDTTRSVSSVVAAIRI